jgi:hypothetical protein
MTLLFCGGAAAVSSTATIDVEYRNIKLVVDGASFVAKDVNGSIVEPFIHDGTTYMPVRAVSQALNRVVTWDGETDTVYIDGTDIDITHGKAIIWHADLNHDGTDDRIIVEIPSISTFTVTPVNIDIYNGDSDILIFEAQAHYAHAGWDGFYLYYEGDNAYLLNWRPGMGTGSGYYEYEIFSFDKSGGKVIFDSVKYEFEADELIVDYNKAGEFVKYMHKVNAYLMVSKLIVDTDEGELSYGTQDSPTSDIYVPKWLFYPGPG